VTHLPVIASLADAHLHIRKEVVKGRTYTRVERIEADDKVEEIARMLTGKDITRISREHARELLEQASCSQATVKPRRGDSRTALSKSGVKEKKRVPRE
jgi:DNA repair protein RecN (Recombination protein N)